MTDEFQGSAQSVLAPSENTFPVTPSDLAALPKVAKYLYVGRGGNVILRAKNSGADVLFENVPAGGYIYVRASHVRATGTTAGAIVACA